jgi:hypothetical protein
MLGNHLPRQCGTAAFTTDPLPRSIALATASIDELLRWLDAPWSRQLVQRVYRRKNTNFRIVE